MAGAQAGLEPLGNQSLDLFHCRRYTIDYRQSKIDAYSPGEISPGSTATCSIQPVPWTH